MVSSRVSNNSLGLCSIFWRVLIVPHKQHMNYVNKNSVTSHYLFNVNLEENIRDCIVMKKHRKRNMPLYMNRNAISMVRKKRKLWLKYQISGEYRDLLAHKKWSDKVTSHVRKAKRFFF